MARHSPVDVVIHVVWATRGRRPSIRPSDDGLLSQVLKGVAVKLRCEVIACGNASNHVHVVVRLAPTVALSWLVQHLKGVSSHTGPWRWQAGYFAESVAASDLQPLVRYVQHQRTRHDDSHPAETWITTPREPAEGGL